MEFLKKSLIVVFVLLSITFKLSAQDYKLLQDAFLTSYTFEGKADYTKAIQALKATGVYDEKLYEVNLRLGWLTYMAGLFTESSAYYQKAINLMPYSIEAKLGFVYPASALGKWDQVATQYKEILKVDSNNTTANYRLGSIYYGKADYTNAYKHFEKLANMYPFDFDIINMYAWTNLKLSKSREAKILFNKALLIKPANASALEGLNSIK